MRERLEHEEQTDPYAGIPDEIVVELAKGDPDAFGALYQRHVRTIYGYAYNRTLSPEEAEDATARTFYKALANIHRYQVRQAPFSAWLFRIAHNDLANWTRAASRRRILPLGDTVLPSREESVTDAFLKKEEASELREVIANLPPDRQQLLVLKFIREFPNARIAQEMGKSEGAVKALLHRTVYRLRDDLNRQPPRKTQSNS